MVPHLYFFLKLPQTKSSTDFINIDTIRKNGDSFNGSIAVIRSSEKINVDLDVRVSFLIFNLIIKSFAVLKY